MSLYMMNNQDSTRGTKILLQLLAGMPILLLRLTVAIRFWDYVCTIATLFAHRGMYTKVFTIL